MSASFGWSLCSLSAKTKPLPQEATPEHGRNDMGRRNQLRKRREDAANYPTDEKGTTSDDALSVIELRERALQAAQERDKKRQQEQIARATATLRRMLPNVMTEVVWDDHDLKAPVADLGEPFMLVWYKPQGGAYCFHLIDMLTDEEAAYARNRKKYRGWGPVRSEVELGRALHAYEPIVMPEVPATA